MTWTYRVNRATQTTSWRWYDDDAWETTSRRQWWQRWLTTHSTATIVFWTSTAPLACSQPAQHYTNMHQSINQSQYYLRIAYLFVTSYSDGADPLSLSTEHVVFCVTLRVLEVFGLNTTLISSLIIIIIIIIIICEVSNACTSAADFAANTTALCTRPIVQSAGLWLQVGRLSV